MAESRMLLTINIRKYLVTQPRNKRARKAVSYIRERVSHYTKTSIENVRLSQDLNSLIVKKFSNRMTPVKLNVKLEAGKAVAEPFAERVEKQEEKKEAKNVKEKSTPAQAQEPKPVAKQPAQKREEE